MSEKESLGKRYEFDNSYWVKPEKFGYINLYQVGELNCECSFKVDPHKQVCNEISYVVSGEGWFSTDGVETKVSSGDIYINKKGHMHAIRSDDVNNLRYFYLAFEFNEGVDENNKALVDIFESKDSIVKDKYDIMIPFIKLIDELYNKDKFAHEMIESYINQILIITYRLFSKKSFSICLPGNTCRTVGFTVYSVIRYVEDNIYNIQNVKSISDYLGYSNSYLSHLFKDKMGMTLQNYINLKKIEKAIEFLKYGRLNITQISIKLNFEAVQSFSKSFKKATGYSPMQYQKLFKKNT